MAAAKHALVEYRARTLAAIAALAIVTGGVLTLAGATDAGEMVWRASVALLAIDLSVEVGRTVIVDRHLGVDTIALVAMVGALSLGGELTALVQRAPTIAHVRVDSTLREVPVGSIQAGDIVVVRTGEVIPVDGT